MKAEQFETEDWLRLALKAGKMSVWQWDVKTNTVTHLSEFVKASEPEALRIRPTPRIREILDVGDVPYTRLEGVHAEDIPLLQEAVKTAISERREYQVVYRNIGDGTTRWIEESGVGTYDPCGECIAVKGLIADITDRRKPEEELMRSKRDFSTLSARFLDIKDEERRRIARELHDSTAQNLFAINMSLARVSQQVVAVEVKEALAECTSLCETSLKEIRTLAYLLHPPMLDDAGLVSALRWYLEGFSRRSGVAVTLIVGQQQMTRVSMEIETDLFRIVQECLANIHRHSGSETAIIRVDEESGQLVLQIEDRGRGMPGWDGMAPAPGSLGVGILGMRERLSQLGGRLEIKSSNSGTTIAAIVPLGDRQPAQRPRRLAHGCLPMKHGRAARSKTWHRSMVSSAPETPSENPKCA